MSTPSSPPTVPGVWRRMACLLYEGVLLFGIVTLTGLGLKFSSIVVGYAEVIASGFVGAFALFRFGGNFLGPIGARIVDKAIAERG